MTSDAGFDTVGRFSDRAEDYVRYRPTYPAAAAEAILDGLGPTDRLLVADIGAGTGISARLIAAAGAKVVAVEPGEKMRRAAERHANVSWIGGRAEATGIDAHAFDVVLCAQAFHWFQPSATLREFARILKRRGRLALMWNRRSTSDPFTAGYREAIVEIGGDITAERMPFDPDVVTRSELFTRPERIAFPHVQHLDLDGLIGRARSASYVPKSGPDGERMMRLLHRLHDRYADAKGVVTLVYETEVYRSHGR